MFIQMGVDRRRSGPAGFQPFAEMLQCGLQRIARPGGSGRFSHSLVVGHECGANVFEV